MDPATIAMLASMVAQIGGQFFGANSQNNANNRNFAAQQQQSQLINQLAMGGMQQGQNPYSASLLNTIGMMRPPGSQGGPSFTQALGGQQQNQQNPFNMSQQVAQQQNQANQGQWQPNQGTGMIGGAQMDLPQLDHSYPGLWNVQGSSPAGGLRMEGGTDNSGITPSAANGWGGGMFNTFEQSGMSQADWDASAATRQQIYQQQMQQQNGQGVQTADDSLSGQGGLNLWQYQNQNPFTYQATQLGAPPNAAAESRHGQVASSIGVNLGTAQQAAAPGSIPFSAASASQVGAPNQISVESLSAPSLGAAPLAGAPSTVEAGQVTGTQGVNAGQDALMQMMRRDVGAGADPFLTAQLQQLGGGETQFNNSDLFTALGVQDSNELNKQVAGLQGTMGDFGKRFGTQMMDRESRLRGDFLNQQSVRNAQIAQGSFENAQNRRQPALNTMQQQQQFSGQQALQNAALQLQAAQGAGQLGMAGQGLNLQGQIANQGAGLQASQANAQLGAQTGQFNAGQQLQQMLAQAQLQQQTGLQGQQLGFQAGSQNAGNALQAAMQNAQMGTQTGQFNAGNQNQLNQLLAQLQQQTSGQNAALGTQTSQQNAAMGNQANNLLTQLQAQMSGQNAQGSNQIALANQQMRGQYDMANANFLNQAGQFNAGMGQTAQNANTAQGNAYNQQLLQMFGQAQGYQQNQQAMNNQLLGIMGGIGVPQQQANPMGGAIADASSTAMMMPLLMQFMNRGQGTGQTAPTGYQMPYSGGFYG